MPKKKLDRELSEGVEVPEDAKIGVAASAPDGIAAVVVEDAAGNEYRRYTREEHGPRFGDLAEQFCEKYNRKDAAGEWLLPVAAKKIADHIELVESGDVKMSDYKRRLNEGISNPGGREWEEVYVPVRPFKTVSVRK